MVNMRIVILGSSGYLGCKLTKKLAENDFEVFCLKLKEDEAPGLKEIKGNIHIVNIDDFDKVDHIDCMINLCCKYQKGDTTDLEVFDANLITPLKMFLMAREKGMTRFITIDTSLPENVNLYSMSKKRFADILKWYSKEFEEQGNEKSIINVVLENYYGPDEPKNRFIPSTIEKLKHNEDIRLTTGDQKRDWIYVEDVIDALCKMVTIDRVPSYLEFPLGSGISLEIRELVRYLKSIIGSESQLLFGAIEKRTNEPDTCADTSVMAKYKIKTKYTWKDGFKKLI